MNSKLKTVLLGGWMAVTTAGVLALGYERVAADQKVTTFDTVNVQRINILEPDGKPRVIIANKSHFPGAYMGGKEYRHFNRRAGGFLFFNDEGDEVGGLIFDNNKGHGGPTAMSGLSLDQYKQDETVVLNYSDNNGVHNAGLSVHDRADWSIEPVLAISDRISRAKTEAEKAAAMADLHAFAKSHSSPGADRLFAGKEGDDALVRLADKQGRARLVLKVGKDGAPAIEMLDEAGKTTKRITGD